MEEQAKDQYESDEVVLQRIVHRLFALAALAEGLARRPAPIRWLILWILNSAVIAGWRCVLDETGFDAGAPADFRLGSAADAEHTANYLILLASVLERELAAREEDYRYWEQRQERRDRRHARRMERAARSGWKDGPASSAANPNAACSTDPINGSASATPPLIFDTS